MSCALFSKLTSKLQYFMRLGDIEFMLLLNCRDGSVVAKAVAFHLNEADLSPKFFAFL
jgi:hypothetical protein